MDTRIENFLKIDFHVHSNYSKDSTSKVRDILERCISLGLNGVSITDHDTVEGSLEALDIVKEENLPILVIPGVEISTLDGHLLAYCVKRDFDPGMSMVETAINVKKHGGFVAVAHPFQFYRHGLISVWKVHNHVDAFEVKNAKYLVGICNALAKLTAKIYKKPGIAGSDAHKVDAVGSAYTKVFVSFFNEREVFKAIKVGKVEVCGGRQKLSNWLRL